MVIMIHEWVCVCITCAHECCILLALGMPSGASSYFGLHGSLLTLASIAFSGACVTVLHTSFFYPERMSRFNSTTPVSSVLLKFLGIRKVLGGEGGWGGFDGFSEKSETLICGRLNWKMYSLGGKDSIKIHGYLCWDGSQNKSLFVFLLSGWAINVGKDAAGDAGWSAMVLILPRLWDGRLRWGSG